MAVCTRLYMPAHVPGYVGTYKHMLRGTCLLTQTYVGTSLHVHIKACAYTDTQTHVQI